MPLKNIFLDLDGPLLDGKLRHYYCYKFILEKFNFTPVGIDEYWESKRALITRLDLLKMSDAEAIYDEFLSLWIGMIEGPEALALDTVQIGAFDSLERLRSLSIKLTLVTLRKNKSALDKQLETTELDKFLDNVLVCDHSEGAEGKVNAVRSNFGIKGGLENALWIGDTEVDFMAAKSLGCPIILVANGLRNECYLRSLEGAEVIPSIRLMREHFDVA